MNPEIAEQLLYESEATLRLVDSLLDELQDDDPQLHLGFPGMQTLQLEPDFASEDPDELPELLGAAAAQARALFESLSRSRRVLERTSLDRLAGSVGENGAARPPADLRGGLERALHLLDQMGSEGEAATVQQTLRSEVLQLLGSVPSQEVLEQQLSYAGSVLRDTELQLSSLLHRLTPARTRVIPFPTAPATL